MSHPDGRLCKKCAKPMRYRHRWARSKPGGPKYLKNSYDCTYCYRYHPVPISWICRCLQCGEVSLGQINKRFCDSECSHKYAYVPAQLVPKQLGLIPIPCPACGSEGPKHKKKKGMRDGVVMSGLCKECSNGKSRDYKARWKEENPDAWAAEYERLKQWQKDNPEKVKEQRRRRWAEKADRLPPHEWARMKSGWQSRCAYCGVFEEDFPKDRSDTEAYLHQDHVLARSRGGKATWDNILPACFNCNTILKGDMPVEEFIELGV